MMLSLNGIKSIRTALRHYERKNGKKSYVKEIEIKTNKEIHLISLYSSKKKSLKIQ